MKKIAPLLAATLLLHLPVRADPTVPIPQKEFAEMPLVDGRVLKGVTVRKLEPDRVAVMHSTGTMTIPFKNLTEDVAAKLGLNAINAAEMEDARLLAAKQEEINLATQKLSRAMAELYYGVILGRATQVLEDGLLVDAKLWKGHYQSYPHHVQATRVHTAKFSPLGLVFVHCDPSGHTDGSSVMLLVGEAPPFSYIAVTGARKNVPAYTTDLKHTWENLRVDGTNKVSDILPFDQLMTAVNARYGNLRMSFETPLNTSR